jgi:hypothetical protein
MVTGHCLIRQTICSRQSRSRATVWRLHEFLQVVRGCLDAVAFSSITGVCCPLGGGVVVSAPTVLVLALQPVLAKAAQALSPLLSLLTSLLRTGTAYGCGLKSRLSRDFLLMFITSAVLYWTLQYICIFYLDKDIHIDEYNRNSQRLNEHGYLIQSVPLMMQGS